MFAAFVQVNAFLGYSEVLDLPDFDLFFSGSGRYKTIILSTTMFYHA